MVAPQSALLALPPPRADSTGLRAQLRGASAIPVEPVTPGRAAEDASFGSTVRAVRAPGAAEGEAAGPDRRGPGRAVPDWLDRDLPAHPSGPFLAQQIGQGVRLVAPTLVARAEVAAYAAAQQRAELAAAGGESALDIHA